MLQCGMMQLKNNPKRRIIKLMPSNVLFQTALKINILMKKIKILREVSHVYIVFGLQQLSDVQCWDTYRTVIAAKDKRE